MKTSEQPIADRLQCHYDALTRAEKQLANTILENYPVSGLGTITAVAHRAGVSTPTVARLVKKLGFKGYPEFRTCLQQELEVKIRPPIEKHDRWAGNAPEGHILNSFTDTVIDNIRKSLARIETESFDNCCELVADTRHQLFVTGGRITGSLAQYLAAHLQMVRSGVTYITSTANAWPHYLADLEEGDVFVVLDIRRYENAVLKMADIAKERGAQVILFTDQWRSPVSRHADYCFSTRIVVPSAWDTTVPALLLLETMIARVQQLSWPANRERIEALEDFFDRSKVFRKFA